MVQAQRDKSTKEILAQIVKVLDYIARIGLVLGGAIFAAASIYLLWAIFNGGLAALESTPTARANQIVSNILYACQLMVDAGIVLIISAAIKHRTDSLVGYALLLWGMLLCFGLPIIIGYTLQGSMPNKTQAEWMGVILSEFRTVGIVSLIAAVPFVLMYLWYHLMGIRRDDAPKRPKGVVTRDTNVSEKSLVRIFCWQMPYCREHVRGYCNAFHERKSCWRLKSGCYCDEDMLLRAMKKSPSQKVELLKETYMHTAKTAGQNLTAAQKRQRCRQCFIYGEHQKQKYRMLSPLVFPAVAALMWMFYDNIIAILEKMLTVVDQVAKVASFTSTTAVSTNVGAAAAIKDSVTNAQSSANVAEYILLGCIGLMVASYLLRGLEYLIFDLQV